jgi:HTH-type transcriptional regulator, competence development regulator
MKNFGETIRELRVAQKLGLREAAIKVEISPAYLSRIERGKESPPRPEVIKNLARVLAADPDVLFRLSSSTDPYLVDFLKNEPIANEIIRLLADLNLSGPELEKIKVHISNQYGKNRARRGEK